MDMSSMFMNESIDSSSNEDCNILDNNDEDDDNNNDDDEDDEILVYLDFSEFDGNDLFNNCQPIHLIDIESSIPKCKINDLYFEGTHQINLGTQLFFNHSNTSRTTSQCSSTTTTNVADTNTNNIRIYHDDHNSTNDIHKKNEPQINSENIDYLGKSVNIIKFELKLINTNEQSNINNY